MANYKVGASRTLEIVKRDTWDGDAARENMFGDGDDIDQETARKGHLVYDADAPELKGSYKLPFADVIDGELKAVDAGLRAAASRLPQTDIPDDVKKEARAVLDAYFERMKEQENNGLELEEDTVASDVKDADEGERIILSVGEGPVDVFVKYGNSKVRFGKVVCNGIKSSPGKLVVTYSVLD